LEALILGRMQDHGGTAEYPDELRERGVKMVFEVREREGRGQGELARLARQLGGPPRRASSKHRADVRKVARWPAKRP
jgi:hypothetical protein